MLKFTLIALLYTIHLTFEKDVNFCDKKYECENKELHSMCKLKHNCGVGPNCKQFKQTVLTEAEKKQLLDKHNTLRSMHALGKGPKSADKKSFPTAANMNELVWDKELEFLAQCWANQCPVYHDSCRKKQDTTFVGQNLAWNSENAILNMTEDFYNECTLAKIAVMDKFDSVKGGPKIGHFTQLIWAKTTQLGCGRSEYSCNYGIAGNWKGEPVYEKGKPCSKCPKGSKCHPKYKGLCSTKPSKAEMPNTCKFAADPKICKAPFQDSGKPGKDQKKDGDKGAKGTKGTKGTKKPGTADKIKGLGPSDGTDENDEDDKNGNCIIERKIIIVRGGAEYGRKLKHNLIIISLLYHLSKLLNIKF